MNTREVWKTSLTEAADCLRTFLEAPETLDKCARFSELLIETLRSDRHVFTCGNGGSHCDSMHFAEELTGRYRKDRRALGALALGDASHTTCVSNDFGFDHVFARQIEGLGHQGDLLIGFSTSGNSKNIIRALGSARAKGLKTVALLGRDGGQIQKQNLADLAIIVPGASSDRIQELHIKLVHIVIETMERALFPENY